MQLGRRVALLSVLAVLALLTAGTQSSGAGGACWQHLLRDWSDGRITGTYSVSCYRTAFQNMPEDLRVYSSAPDDLRAALQRAAARQGRARVGSRRLAGVSEASKPVGAQSSGPSLPVLLGVGLGGFALLLAALGVLARRRQR